MAKPIIGLLEAIKVDVEKSALLARLECVPRLLDMRVQLHAVGQAREAIVIGEVADVQMLALLFVNVLEGANPLDDLPSVIQDWCASALYPDVFTSAVHNPKLEGQWFGRKALLRPQLGCVWSVFWVHKGGPVGVAGQGFAGELFPAF